MNVQLIELDLGMIWFILAAYGLTQILVYSKIFENIRPRRDQYGLIGYMANCAMCMGFWVGVFVFHKRMDRTIYFQILHRKHVYLWLGFFGNIIHFINAN